MRGALSGALPLALFVPAFLGPSGSRAAELDGFAHVVPIVLSSTGMNGSYFTSELTLTNRSPAEVEIELGYTAAFGAGSGSVSDRIAARGQKTVPDAIAYLRSLGLAIPTGENVGGTLRVTFVGLSSPTDAAVSARTTTPVPEGRAGLAYGGLVGGLKGRAFICGLRQDARDRSNLALVNMGGPDAGSVTLRIVVYPASPEQGPAKTLPAETLAPGGFKQLGGVLDLAGFSAGWVLVERQTGTAPYTAYGVINDQQSSDGSFVPPVLESDTGSSLTIVVPAVVEAGPFTSELVLTNPAAFKHELALTLVADGITATGSAVTATLTMQGSSQVVIDDVVDWLRQRTTGLPPKGTGVAGALIVGGAKPGEYPFLMVAACRTSAPGAAGRYGLYYLGVGQGKALDDAGWISGLRQDAENRTNLAIVNTAESSPASTDTFAIDVFDGKTGSLAGTLTATVAPRRWVQIPMVLDQLPVPVEHAYVKVRRTGGLNPFLAYAVVNDGAGPGLRSGDGAFLAAERDCVYTSPSRPEVPGWTGGGYATGVTIADGCPWVLVPSAPWITLSSSWPTSGTGTASVFYKVTRNEAATARTGYIQVGGARIEVVQTANAVGPYDGSWSGSTGQGLPISFVVEKGEVVSLTLGMSISLSCGSAIGTFTKQITNRSGIYPDRFETKLVLSTAGTGSPTTTVTGTFGSTSQAGGSFHVSSILWGATDCLATSQPGSSWTATRQ